MIHSKYAAQCRQVLALTEDSQLLPPLLPLLLPSLMAPHFTPSSLSSSVPPNFLVPVCPRAIMTVGFQNIA